jgi:hypothetical protein
MVSDGATDDGARVGASGAIGATPDGAMETDCWRSGQGSASRRPLVQRGGSGAHEVPQDAGLGLRERAVHQARRAAARWEALGVVVERLDDGVVGFPRRVVAGVSLAPRPESPDLARLGSDNGPPRRRAGTLTHEGRTRPDNRPGTRLRPGQYIKICVSSSIGVGFGPLAISQLNRRFTDSVVGDGRIWDIPRAEIPGTAARARCGYDRQASCAPRSMDDRPGCVLSALNDEREARG